MSGFHLSRILWMTYATLLVSVNVFCTSMTLIIAWCGRIVKNSHRQRVWRPALHCRYFVARRIVRRLDHRLARYLPAGCTGNQLFIQVGQVGLMQFFDQAVQGDSRLVAAFNVELAQ